MKNFLLAILFISSFSLNAFAQTKSSLSKQQWVDSVFNSLTNEQRIAQLMIIRAHSNLGQQHVDQVTDLIKKYDVGGLCFFQGGPVRQANLTNYYQKITQTPLMVTIDGEWGLGMRLDSVINFPRQLMIGAVPDAQLVYQFGRAVGEQCKRIGIHVNFAPVVDINNNPNNPVINDRSFGEDKYKVALYGVQYMKGMQDVGVMACAKHFPGHGDVAVDSHYDLPIINKTRQQLDSLELYPFRELFKAGVGSVMIAHLYIPSIDTIKNQATSLSYKNVTELLRNELGYQGLTFTDALEMQGVTKFYPAGEASVQSLVAGNDMLCLPGDVPGTIQRIIKAIDSGRLSWDNVNAKVRKVLNSKYDLGLNNLKPIVLQGLTADLNKETNRINKLISANALTLVQNMHPEMLPLKATTKVAYMGIGVDSVGNTFSRRMKKDYNADVYTFNYKKDRGSISMLASTLEKKYDVVIIGMHNYSRRPANNFGISAAATEMINQVQRNMPSITFVFGNPYAIKNISKAPNLIACYEDDDITQSAAADLLQGKIAAKGKLPVTVTNELKFGTGVTYNPYFPVTTPESIGLSSGKLLAIDSLANDAVAQRAVPGCVVLVAKNGKIGFYRSYGYTNYDSTELLSKEAIYDLASVTKVSATTVSIMKLYEEGKIDLKKSLGTYLPMVRGSDKENLSLENILLHQAGLVAWIPFYRETIDTATGVPSATIYAKKQDDIFSIRVAEDLYMRKDWQDTLYHRMATSKLGAPDRYIYSDNDFIYLGKVVEAVSGMKLEDYVRETFYQPLNMVTTSFKPRDHYAINDIAPTEQEKLFRQQQIRGDVHDPGAAMFGGVAGHAGLFSNAYDLAQLYQLLLNGGELNGQRLLKKETIDFFTAYSSSISRRGLGFDKPEKDNATRAVPYPTLSTSPETFGHTGFTGTCVWADPKDNLLYIFLSNRVAPNGGDANKLLKMNVRSNIHETIYQALIK